MLADSYLRRKSDDMTHSESWNAFIDELRTYVREHHHFPNKHTRLLSKVKYTRKKINDGTLEDWMVRQAHQPGAVPRGGEYEESRELGI